MGEPRPAPVVLAAAPPPAPCTIGIIGSRRRHTPADERLLHRRLRQYLRPERGDRLLALEYGRGAAWFAARYAQVHALPFRLCLDWYDLASTADLLMALPAPDRTGHCEPAIALFEARGLSLYRILV